MEAKISELAGKSINEILNFMAEHCKDQNILLECIKDINPTINLELKETVTPINWPYKPNSIEEVLSAIIELTKESDLLPIGWFGDKPVDLQICYLKPALWKRKRSFNEDSPKVAKVNDFIDMIYDPENYSKKTIDQKTNVEDVTKALTKIKKKGEFKPMPYGLGNRAWGTEFYPLQRLYYKEKIEENKRKISNNCYMLAYDGLRPCNQKTFIRRYTTGGKIDEDEWYTDGAIKKWCGSKVKDKLDALPKIDHDEIMRIFKDKEIPFHARLEFEGKDYSTEGLGGYAQRDIYERPGVSKCSTEDRLKAGEIDEDFTHPSIDFMLRSVVNGLSREETERRWKNFSKCDSSFGNLQRRAAMKNLYVTGVKFGKSPKFYTYMFSPENRNWMKNKKGDVVGKWLSGSSLERKIKELNVPRVSDKTTKAFMQFQDVMIPAKEFEKDPVEQLSPLQPSAFGYMQKVLQLYPLGKGAYLKGPHQGVSSTYSQAYSERHGLWNMPKTVPVKRSSVPEFQYGMQRKKSSCFGKANEWSTKGPLNAWTGRRIPGIEKYSYGYRGTQSVYGGNTGVAGYPSLGSQQLRQGLVPFKVSKRNM